MQNVSRFEANLLRLLYYFLRREPIERALPLVEARCELPPCLSRPAVRLVQDALAKGCTFLLAQRGGWRDERHLRGDKVVGGRLWQRTPPGELALKFSRHSLAFLIWITAARPGDKEPGWGPAHDQLTPADLLLLFFVHEGLRETVEGLGAPALRKRAPYVQHGLCWLAYPEDFAAAPAGATPVFGPWTTGLGSCMLEAMQQDLAARWVHLESGKERITDPQLMRNLGQSQERVLNAFLDAAQKDNRRDLARFLLRAAAQLLPVPPEGSHPPLAWVESEEEDNPAEQAGSPASQKPRGGSRAPARQKNPGETGPETFGDWISTFVPVYPVLPREQMAQLLSAELAAQGFREQQQKLVRADEVAQVSFDKSNLNVSVAVARTTPEGTPAEPPGERFRTNLTALLEGARDRAEAEAFRRKASALTYMWTGGLQMAGQRLADRAATYQAAHAFLRMLDRLQGWARWARNVGYFDEDYAPAQLWLSDWERFHGDLLHVQAQMIVRNLDPMRQA